MAKKAHYHRGKPSHRKYRVTALHSSSAKVAVNTGEKPADPRLIASQQSTVRKSSIMSIPSGKRYTPNTQARDFGYVRDDLRRIGLSAGICTIVLIILTIILR